jgi:hypothetical protein
LGFRFRGFQKDRKQEKRKREKNWSSSQPARFQPKGFHTRNKDGHRDSEEINTIKIAGTGARASTRAQRHAQPHSSDPCWQRREHCLCPWRRIRPGMASRARPTTESLLPRDTAQHRTPSGVSCPTLPPCGRLSSSAVPLGARQAYHLCRASALPHRYCARANRSIRVPVARDVCV